MTKDEVLQMAMEAGLFDDHAHMYEAEIIRFAKLVEQRTREECAKWKRDAERYQWLRIHSVQPAEPWSNHHAPESFDTAIDEAIRATSTLQASKVEGR